MTRLVLVGGGHTHMLVLADFAGSGGAADLHVTLISPQPHTTYTGMVPGVIAGQYALRQAQVDVAALAQRAGAQFIADRAVAVDAERATLALADARALPYDLLSFDIGAETALPADVEPGAMPIRLKPFEPALAALDAALAAPPAGRGRRIVIVGGGAGGCEVAFALATRLRDEAACTITVCDEAAHPVAERGRRTAAAVERAFAERAIRFVGGRRVHRIAGDAVVLAGGASVPADLVIWATGASAPALFAQSGLPTDARGFLRVGGDLRSAGFPAIFAAGDCAALSTHPQLPKAGVYAVRQAPTLAHNLRAAPRGEPLRVFRAQRRFLALLNTGDGRAILSYGGQAARGRWAWRLKDWIDRRFVDQFS